MKPTNTILLLGAGAALIALRNRTARVGAIYKEIPSEFYPCVDGTYSDHNRNRISGVRKNYSIKHSVGFL